MNWTRVLSLLVLSLPSLHAGEAEDAAFFENRIRPVLMRSCFKCHGGDKVSDGLRVDSREALLEGGQSGPALVAGDAETSLLVQAIRRTDAKLAMPPEQPLDAAVVKDFEQWIQSGAIWPASALFEADEVSRHWAFQPVSAVEPPSSTRYSHPIDRFLEAEAVGSGVVFLEQADRRTLFRRAALDLTGLPPGWDRASRFVSSDRPEAFSEWIEELLASPRYGERWGRHWLDLARYADTAGENSDYPIPQAHLYRDYVIQAFNADKPYDEFLQEQIAGDILALKGDPQFYEERVVATGFIAQAKRFGTGDLEGMHLIIEDTLDTLGKAVLGLSMRCARCHDHKYDPTSMQDYYALYGMFQSTSYPFPGGESVREQRYLVPTVHPEVLAKRDAAYFESKARELEQLKQELASASGEVAKAVKSRLDAIEALVPSRLVPVAYAVRDGKSEDAYVQRLGEPRNRGELVPRGTPSFLPRGGAFEKPFGSGRLELAQWLTHRDNPLTARVMVNRIWQHHFGKPLVDTPSDFGLRGAAPSHPELLDWLAHSFMESGWSIKAMHRLIMISEAYQRSSEHQASNATLDSSNRLYWKFDRRRMDAETIRDSFLLLGGQLDLTVPGEHPFPPKKQWTWTAHRQFKAVYPSQHRSVYLMVQRLHPHPFLSIFNGPDTSATTARRDVSTVPLQALFMSNSDLVETQARGLAEDLLRGPGSEEDRLLRACRKVYLRDLKPGEGARFKAYLDALNEALSEEGVPPAGRPLAVWTSLSRALLTSNEFLFID